MDPAEDGAGRDRASGDGGAPTAKPPRRSPLRRSGVVDSPSSGRKPTAFAAWWNRRATVWLVATVILALASATAALAAYTLTREAPVRVAPSPVTPVAPVAPTASAAPAPEVTNQPPAATALPPITAGTVGSPHNSGAAELATADEFNFDTGHDAPFLSDDDIVATDHGITGNAGVPLHAYGSGTAPTIVDCAATTPAEWTLTLRPAQLTAGTHVCYFTTDGRYGYLTIEDAQLNADGEVDSIELTYLVWKADGEP